MTNDLLQRSTRALASSTAETGPDGARLEQTLQRIQQARRPAPRRRQMLRTLYWTLAALFMGVGAWANATGRVSWFRAEPEPASTPESTSESAAATEPRRASASAKIAAPVAEETPALAPPSAPELPEAPPAVLTVRKKASAVAPAPAVLPPPPTPAPLPPESAVENVDAAYRDAHRAHFTERDYARALAGWDRYLQLARADHSLLPEARFNRAIALYRLGQLPAARKALEPFALGEYGGYRRDEARRLIDVIDRN